MMHLVLFILYFLLLCFAITRLQFFRQPIRPVFLLLLFSLHVAAGCIHNWIAFHFFPNHGDIWFFFDLSVEMKQRLLQHPLDFFASFFSNKSQFNITDTSRPMLGVQYDVLLYLNTFLNFASFNNLYINTLLFSLPVFAGSVALFKMFYQVFGKALPAFCALLLPSTLFWTAVTYKDSLFYMAIGFFYYYFFKTTASALRKASWLLFFAAVMLLTRANALITLLPAFFFLLLTEKKRVRKRVAFIITVAMLAAATIFLHIIIPGGMLTAISVRQQAFQMLEGESRIVLPVLAPTAASFLHTFPRALLNGFLQPLPGASGKSIYMAFSVELLFIWAIVLFACWLLIRKKTISLGSVDIACLLFAVPGLVIIGYMVPFAGAIVRYRSVYLPFLLAPFVNVICKSSLAGADYINQWLGRKVML